MTSEGHCASLIERYLCTRGRRFFRGRHDGQYFFVADTEPLRLYVHLEISPEHHDVLTIRITPVRFFPAVDRPRLTHVADKWNTQNRQVIAIVHESTDPQRIGVAARRSQWMRNDVTLKDFSSFVDRIIAAATDLFAELTPDAELSTMSPPLLRDAG
jgi:hypothetical protein